LAAPVALIGIGNILIVWASVQAAGMRVKHDTHQRRTARAPS